MAKKTESEKAVTEILANNQNLKSTSKSTRNTLSKFLKNSDSKNNKTNFSKYSFITSGLWKW